MLTLKELPPKVRVITTLYDCWIVGSASKEQAIASTLKDIDIIVPFHVWTYVASILPKDTKLNSFGGHRFKDNGILIDIWPDTLDNIFLNHICLSAWQPKYNIRVYKEKK